MDDQSQKPTHDGQKPYVKLASTLVLIGTALFALERFGLESPGLKGHLDPNLLSVLVIAPIALVFAGAIVWIVGKMRRL